MKFIVLPLLVALSGTVVAESVAWLKIDAPPYFNLSGDLADQGIADQIIRLLVANLPEYEHSLRTDVTVSCIAVLQKAGQKVGAPATLWSKAKEDYLYFSVPALINPPYALVTSEATSVQFGTVPGLSLRKVLETPTLQLGMADRAYGDPVDALLQSHRDQGHVVRRAGINVFTSLLQMVNLNRIDFVIGTPYELAYAQRQFADKLNVVSYSIDEIPADSYLLSYVAFPKTPWGKELRDKVNAILIRERRTAAYRAMFTDWLDPRSTTRLLAVWPRYMDSAVIPGSGE